MVNGFDPGQTFVQALGGQHLLKCLVHPFGLDPDRDVIFRPGIKS